MSLNRSSQPGWQLLQLGDIASQRRGIWLRITETQAELCAGREGDDFLLQIPLPGKDSGSFAGSYNPALVEAAEESMGLPSEDSWKELQQAAAWHYDISDLDGLLELDDMALANTMREWLRTLKLQLARNE